MTDTEHLLAAFFLRIFIIITPWDQWEFQGCLIILKKKFKSTWPFFHQIKKRPCSTDIFLINWGEKNNSLSLLSGRRHEEYVTQTDVFPKAPEASTTQQKTCSKLIFSRLQKLCESVFCYLRNVYSQKKKKEKWFQVIHRQWGGCAAVHSLRICKKKFLHSLIFSHKTSTTFCLV